MNILKLSLVLSIVYLYCLYSTQSAESTELCEQHSTHNVTEWAKSRQKRFLIFATAGLHKFIVSFILQVPLYDKKAWRSLFGAWNIQWQHSLPSTTQLWWNSTFFPASRSSEGRAMPPIAPVDYPIDLSATLLYATVETYMNSKGMNGRECLQRAICENAQVQLVGGVLDRIYQRLLTPEKAMEDYYHDSYAAGAKGADCYKTYFGCPKGESVFDQFVYITDAE